MDGSRHRLTQPRQMLRAALSSVALAALLTLFALTPQTSAGAGARATNGSENAGTRRPQAPAPEGAHPARAGDSVTLTFTVIVKAGTPPSDVLFWFCADAQADGTGCEEMTAQADGTFTYQFATTTGASYQHVTIEWSHGRLPTDKGPIPAPPVHLACDYQHPFNVTASDPRSYTCNADFTVSTVTPVPSAAADTPTPAASPGPARGSDDNSTLVTGLQIIIGVGLFLFVLLLIILVWQRVSAPGK